MRTTSSMMTDASICGKSEFCRELARIAETDNMKANMMWNNYLNNHMLDMKKKQDRKNKKTNRKFAKDAEKKLKEQLANERRRDQEKFEAYQNGVKNQRNDHMRAQQKNFLKKKNEDQKWKSDIAKDNAEYYDKMAKNNHNKLNKYRNGLNEQVEHKRQTDRDQRELDKEISARNRNYLIDDTWKIQHQKQIKDHLKKGLINQIQDKEEEKDYERKRKEADDEQYRYDLQNANDADLRKREEIKKQKHAIFVDEIKKQEREKRAQNDLETALKNEEDEKVRAKLVEDHMRYLDAEKKKKELLNEHLRKVKGQVQELNEKKRRELMNEKKPHGTTLVTKGDYVAYEHDLQANLDMADLKKRNKKKIQEEDRKFANEVKQKNIESLERDRLREMQKLKTYQDGMANQKADQMRKIQKEMQNLKDEDEKWKSDIAKDNARYYQMKADDQNNKLMKYRNGLEEQIQHKRQTDQDQRELDKEISARNRNYLIDDTWKVKHQQQIKDHLKKGLINQIEDKEEEKDYERKRKEADDEQYRYDLQNANDADLRKRKEIESNKKQIFKNEIKNQEAQKRKQQEIENALKNAEDEKVRAKLVEDHMRHLDAEKKKKALMEDHLRQVENQKKEKIKINKKNLIQSKQPYGTSLITKGDNVKYFDYKEAMKLYPLRSRKKKSKK